MKEDDEAKIAHLESELLRWQSDYAALAESEKTSAGRKRPLHGPSCEPQDRLQFL